MMVLCGARDGTAARRRIIAMNYLGLISPRLPALLLALLLAACPGKDGVLTDHTADGSEDDTGSSTTGESDTIDGPTTGPDPTTGDPVCPCIVDDPGDQWIDPSLPTCADPICPKADAFYALECDTGCSDDDDIDTEAVDCALAALRDRSPGLLLWSLRLDNWEGKLNEGYVWIRGDGSAIWREWQAYDLSFLVWSSQVVELPTSEAYAQCLADPDPRNRFDCLRQSLSGQDNLVCDEGWVADGI